MKKISLNIPYDKAGLNSENFNPLLETVTLKYSPEIGIKKRPAVIICPGGGYEYLSDRETQPIAMRFASHGINAFILNYSVNSPFPAALLELAYAVKYVRENAETFDINPNKILLCGFSAGGHLSACLGTLWNSEYLKNIIGSTEIFKPNGMILCYPVITGGKYCHKGSIESLLGKNPPAEMLELISAEKQVNDNTPKTFIWHCVDDQTVPVENTINFTEALSRHKVSFECHIYPFGGHGLALADESTAKHEGHINNVCSQWTKLAFEWIKREFFTEK